MSLKSGYPDVSIPDVSLPKAITKRMSQYGNRIALVRSLPTMIVNYVTYTAWFIYSREKSKTPVTLKVVSPLPSWLLIPLCPPVSDVGVWLMDM